MSSRAHQVRLAFSWWFSMWCWHGSSDPAIFTGTKGQPLWPHGWVIRLSDNDTGRGARFRWRMVDLGGVPWEVVAIRCLDGKPLLG